MKTKDNSGYILPMLLITVLLLTLSITYITSLSLTTYNLAMRDVYKANAQLTADAALDIAMTTLNTTGASAYTSTFTPEQTFYTSGNLSTTYQIALRDTADPDRKVVAVVARAKIRNSTTVTRRYELDIQAVTSGNGPGVVVSGVGGLILNSNSRITGGDVIVNGSIFVNNNASIGLSTNPLNVWVAHQSCPPPPITNSYPQVCTSGQPITAKGPIYANVRAQNQTNGTNMFNPGLTSSTFAPVGVPGYNRTAHKAAVQATYLPTDSVVACGNGQTRTWPANIRITGTVNLGNNCNLTITGNVWITGNLNFGNGTIVRISNGTGTTQPVVMIDGPTGVFFGTNAFVYPNNTNTGAQFITTWWNTNTATNGNFTCGNIPDPLDCTEVTGLALYSSQSVRTIDYKNGSSAPFSVLRTLWTLANIENNGTLGAVAGQTVQMGNNAVIQFTTIVPGSSNLRVIWAKRGYMRVYQ